MNTKTDKTDDATFPEETAKVTPPSTAGNPQANHVANNLLDQLDEAQAEGWRPKAGDKIVGQVVERSMSSPGQYGAYPILTLQHPDGSKTAVHAFHTVLRNEIERLAVLLHDTIAIKYEGIKSSDKAGGQEYESYRVALQRSVANATMLARIQAEKAV